MDFRIRADIIQMVLRQPYPSTPHGRYGKSILSSRQPHCFSQGKHAFVFVTRVLKGSNMGNMKYKEKRQCQWCTVLHHCIVGCHAIQARCRGLSFIIRGITSRTLFSCLILDTRFVNIRSLSGAYLHNFIGFDVVRSSDRSWCFANIYSIRWNVSEITTVHLNVLLCR